MCGAIAPHITHVRAALKDDRRAPVDEHPVLAVPRHGAREDGALDVGAPRAQGGRGVAVRDPDDVLLDDRPLVEVLGRVVRRRPDDLDAAPPGLLVGRRAGEGGQSASETGVQPRSPESPGFPWTLGAAHDHDL